MASEACQGQLGIPMNNLDKNGTIFWDELRSNYSKATNNFLTFRKTQKKFLGAVFSQNFLNFRNNFIFYFFQKIVKIMILVSLISNS